MNKMIKIELERAFRSKTLTISLIAGLAVALVQYFAVSFRYRNDVLAIYTGHVGTYPISAFKMWMDLDTIHPYITIYLTMFPFLAVLPFGISYFSDLKSGYVKSIFSRADRVNYMWAKFIAVFVSGGVAVIIPLIFNLFITMMTFPALTPIATGGFYLCAVQINADIFFTHPFLFVGIYILITFIYGGVYASIALSVSRLFDYSFFVFIFPFIIYYGLGIISSYVSTSIVNTINPMYLLMPIQPGRPTLLALYGEPVILLLIVLIIYFWRVKKHDIL